MDKRAINKVIDELSERGVAPYDLLLAVGRKKDVPSDIEGNRTTRVILREGLVSPDGYVRNAIEDLKKMPGLDGREMLLMKLETAISGGEFVAARQELGAYVGSLNLKMALVVATIAAGFYFLTIRR